MGRTASLQRYLPNTGFRDNKGQVSVRGRGGRQKRYYRYIDWKRDLRDVQGTVMSIEYDPNRTCNISLIEYTNGEKRYILHPVGLVVGATVVAGSNAPIQPGNALPLREIPIGVLIHNVELYPGKGGNFARSAGNAITIIGKDETYAIIKLPSQELRKVLLDCYATIGSVDNQDKRHEVLGKAGRKRYMGRRPKNRGTAMNPASHPHGGGEGRVGEGMNPKTPWGKPARGVKTRRPKKWSNKFIVKRRK